MYETNFFGAPAEFALKSEAATDHNHDSQYAKIGDVAGAVDLTPYALIANASTDHDHDTVYAKIEDIPDAVDLTAYALVDHAATDHNHDGVYAELYRPVFFQTVETLELTTETLLGKLLLWNPTANATLTISHTPALDLTTATQIEVDEFTSDESYLPFEVEVYNMSAFTITVVPPEETPGTTVTTHSRFGYQIISAGGSATIKMVRRTTTVNGNRHDQTLEYLIVGSLEAPEPPPEPPKTKFIRFERGTRNDSYDLAGLHPYVGTTEQVISSWESDGIQLHGTFTTENALELLQNKDYTDGFLLGSPSGWMEFELANAAVLTSVGIRSRAHHAYRFQDTVIFLYDTEKELLFQQILTNDGTDDIFDIDVI